MKYIKNALIGLLLGIANVIPGISGGTIAVVFGIYEQLLDVIQLNVQKWIENWKFLLSLALGMGAGILGFATLITLLYENFQMATSFFFVGIVLGSCPMIYRMAVPKNSRLTAKQVVPFLLGLAVMVIMTFFRPEESGQVMRDLSLKSGLLLTIAAALGAIAMIIPGISGSFLMMILGTYMTVITAIKELNIPLLLPIGLGVVLGLLGGAKLIRVLLEKYKDQTYGAIFGLVVGSILGLWPPVVWNMELVVAALALLGGAVMTYLFGRKTQ